jgi:hypothetical protein
MSYEEHGDMDDKDMIHSLHALEVLKTIETCSPCKSFTQRGCKRGFLPVYGYCHKLKLKTKKGD